MKLIEENPGRYPRAKCLQDLQRQFHTPHVERYEKVLDELVHGGEVQLLRSKGLALGAAVVKKVRPTGKREKPPRESEFYEPTRRYLETAEGFNFSYVDVVSEKGKKWKPLPAIPDVAAIAYLPSPFSDELELTVVEVKAEQPKSYHLSEAFRYSRFADYCYIGITKEELQGHEKQYSGYLEEAERLGIGVISFWRHGAKGKERYNIDLDAKKQTPDQIEKQVYLAVIGVWKCLRCQTYHLLEEGRIVEKERSEKLFGKDTESETRRFLERFICSKCQTGA